MLRFLDTFQIVFPGFKLVHLFFIKEPALPRRQCTFVTIVNHVFAQKLFFEHSGSVLGRADLLQDTSEVG